MCNIELKKPLIAICCKSATLNKIISILKGYNVNKVPTADANSQLCGPGHDI